MNFLKAHSFGNDFIILNNPAIIPQKKLGELAKKLCDRHTGIGADGILVVLPSLKADIQMKIINSDGSEANMCGNGIRCFAKYIFEHDLIKKKKVTIETLAGIIKSELTLKANTISSIKVDMGEPLFKTSNINRPINVLDKKYHITSMIMGTTHTIIFVDKLDQREITKIGASLEKHKLFPQKTNVDFVKIINRSKIKLITWERGVGLSLACGTGACAATVAACLNSKTARNVTVQMGMGDLLVEWHEDNMVHMTGPAPENICEGKILL